MVIVHPIDSVTGFFGFVSLLATFILRHHVLSTFSSYQEKVIEKDLTAQQIARELLNRNGCSEVNIEFSEGRKSDRFNVKNNTLLLSSSVYSSKSIAAISLVAHECGHAMQKRDKYSLLVFCNLMDPIAQYGGFVYLALFLLGLILTWIEELCGVAFVIFLVLMLLALAMLPVEYNASKRALIALIETGYLNKDERVAVKNVMDVVAFNYAILLTNILAQLVGMLLRFGLKYGFRSMLSSRRKN